MLHENEILKILTELYDLEEASDALLELKGLNPQKCQIECLDILKRSKGDIFYQSFALDLLYSIDIPVAIDAAKNKLKDQNMYFLGIVLSLVTMDSEQNDLRVNDFAEYLWEIIEKTPKNQLSEINDEVELFTKSFMDVGKK